MSKTPGKKSFFTLPVWLVLTTLFLFGMYSVYWVWMAGEIYKGAQSWIEDQRGLGYEMTYSEMYVSGWPYRFVLDAKAPEIRDPFNKLSWKGERLQLVAMSWNLYHIIGLAPGVSEITLSDGTSYTITPAKKSAASLKLNKGFMREFRLSLPALEGETRAGQPFDLTNLTLGLRPMPDTPDTLQFSLSVEDMNLPERPRNAEWLGQNLHHLVIWLEVESFYPLLEGEITPVDWRLDKNKLELRRGEVDWGPLDIAARASVVLDRETNPDGTVGIHLERSEDLKAALITSGNMTPETEALINTISLLSKNDNFATVKVKDRGVYYLNNKLTAH